MIPRQFLVLISAFVTFISSFDLLFVLAPARPRLQVVNLYSITSKVDSAGSPAYRQSLVYIDAQRHSRSVHTIPEADAAWNKTYAHPTLSPKGNYISTNYSTYEGYVRPSIFRVSDNTDLLRSVDLNFDVRSGLVWSPDERYFLINSFYEKFSDTGRPGIFISYSPFSEFRPIMEFSPAQALAGTKITGVEISGNKVYFTLVTASLPQTYSFNP